MTARPTMTTSTFEGVASLRLTGELDLACAEELRQIGEGAITDYVNTMRIDLSGVTFIDSTALGALISIRNKAEQHGCALILEKPDPRVTRVLEVTGLTQIFTIETG